MHEGPADPTSANPMMEVADAMDQLREVAEGQRKKALAAGMHTNAADALALTCFNTLCTQVIITAVAQQLPQQSSDILSILSNLHLGRRSR